MADFGREQLLDFPARYLPGLPSRTRFNLEHSEIESKITFASFEVSDPAEASAVVFDGIELGALVAGVEAGRVWPADFDAWVRRKREDPQFRVTYEEALGGVRAHAGRASTLGAVLNHLGLRLVSVDVGSVGQPPEVRVEQAA